MRGGVAIHRVIVGAKPGQIVDHINGDSLDNRRANLRIVTKKQNNCAKHKLRANKSSRFKGVHWCKSKKKWLAGIRMDRKSHRLGSFLNEKEAALAYDKAAIEMFREFAVTNKMLKLL